MSAVLARILDCGVVAVMRSDRGDVLADVAEKLASGGVTAIEVTFTVPRAHRVLEAVASRLGDRIVLGAGTVLDPETARIAILSGAEFIVSPTLNVAVIEMCKRYGKLVFPGAFTPTEILTAWQAGADIVKVFPADVGGPAYFKAIHGPLPSIRLMPTGGVDLDTAADFIRAGACALGVGSALVRPQLVRSGNLTEIESLARQFVEIVRQARAENGQRR
ncbi:MAG: bifunctional 4-hydroxy-2-oxoglutarate aldolase/2-dehydro-3-deoxy-phosphogluconate aldolase [Thermogutta sp.]|uniref:bifunctional 4-hydroxy-2-oxoglutarate aldolase/2-dehydro-3-deoxy-phosphogluconate aldolase n=1 Tax=Thermogutta sp. TaxID=1962930 RepID=UPI00199B72F4|nr:bifunctional 4-hydroxy-2-oxoglutarate aldolase/2-dehydro-3-deoxy-phosphogluconate aldolase [Thermogutta sp.]MBC7352369.1 bifunctional 4-hydroxy-2-oxoglutarate aldolase/2-dehydro-3-deoxy-phosphogluconate aldolase [Thermogutta sp.]